MTQLIDLENEIRLIKKQYEWNKDFLSRWKFENCLDAIALKIHEYCYRELRTEAPEEDFQMGCSILYKGDESHYYVGGASSNRIRMDPLSRYYECPESNEAKYNSFTMFAAAQNVSFVLDDFQESQKIFSNAITHITKKCELDEKSTQSFYCVPCFTEPDYKPKTVTITERGEKNTYKNNSLPLGILRLSFSKRNMASKIDKLLKNNLLIELFGIIAKGQSIVSGADRNNALAIADLQAELLKNRNSEYLGLSHLTSHIQTLFGNCECSIFLAHKKPVNGGISVYLYLAATTAQSEADQHKKFRQAFIDNREHYTCHFDVQGNPLSVDVTKEDNCGKTEFAYYENNKPFLREKNTRSSHFHGKGEFTSCAAFLAVAIPSPNLSSKPIKRLPYGVIRIVRKTQNTLDESDKRLAAAIARAITYWVDFFPKNEELTIIWEQESLKQDVSRVLFNIAKFDPGRSKPLERFERANLEVTKLLQKIFYNCKKIKIKRMFSGRSGAVILLVENDNGLDLIMKCSRKETRSPEKDNEILREIDNYDKCIQGKLELNHNIIYKEMVRETINLVGFATSFLGGKHRNRISMTDYFNDPKKKEIDHDLGGTFTRIVDKLINEVWNWWYNDIRTNDPKLISKSDYVKTILQEDCFFEFFNDMKNFDARIFPSIQNILRVNQRPSQIWELFKTWLNDCQNADNIPWQKTVTHGDTHGDNIFFDPESMDMWIIDFARTGWRTSIFDLALIETDIKFRHLPNIIGNQSALEEEEYINKFWDFECDLASQINYEGLIIPRWGGNDYLKIASKAITNIRQIAAQSFERKGRFDDYKLLLFLLTFKYMKVIDEGGRKFLPYISSLALINNIVFNNCSKCCNTKSSECKYPEKNEYQEIYNWTIGPLANLC